MSTSTDFHEMLNLFYSPNERVRTRACKYLFSIAFTDPKSVVTHIPEIHLLISSLCSASVLPWGTITSLCNAISIAVNVTREVTDAVFADLVEISYEVTQTVFTANNESEYNAAILWPIADVIVAFYKPSKISIDLFLAITDHCVLGFLPQASLIRILVDRFPHHIEPLDNLPSETYEKLAKPLSSQDDQIVQFYLVLWTWMMKTMTDRPIVVRALATQADRLVLLMGKREFSELARVLVDCIRLSPIDKREVGKLAAEKCERAINRLKGTQSFDSKRRNSEYLNTSKDTKSYSCLTTNGEIQSMTKGIGKRKKWNKRHLVLLEEAGVLFWSTAPNLMQKGGAFHLSEIRDWALLPEGSKEQGKENVMRILTRTKEEILIAFQSYNIANTWKNAISAQKTKQLNTE